MVERRTCAKLIRFTPEELARVVERARAARQVPARYIREAAVGAVPRPRHALAADEIVRRVGRLAVTLRTLSPAIHAQDPARAAAFDAALADLLDLIRAVG